jgi:signal transduction histidine kinase
MSWVTVIWSMVARTIVEAHRGRLWAENRNGGGAAFRFTLPIAEEGTAV